MKRALLPIAFVLAGCVSFARAPTTPELAAQAEIKAYYGEVELAFERGDADALAALFDPSITRPMTREQILEWGQTFFRDYKETRFKIRSLSFEDLGPGVAVVRLAYRVATEDGRGDFGGVERDYLGKAGGRWRITAWERLPEETKEAR